MHSVRVGLVADPAKPTEIARRLGDLGPPDGNGQRPWDIEVLSEPFTVACEDVDTAMSRLTDQARAALGDKADESELTAAAGAIRAGLPTSALKSLQALRSDRPLVVPIAVLTDLVAEGVPPAQATQSVLDLARQGRPDDEFVALRRQVQMQRRGAEAPGPLNRPTLQPAGDPPVDR